MPRPNCHKKCGEGVCLFTASGEMRFACVRLFGQIKVSLYHVFALSLCRFVATLVLTYRFRFFAFRFVTV